MKYGSVKETRKRRVWFWLGPEVLRRIDDEAATRSVPRQGIIESAVLDRFSLESQEDRDARIARRLNRIDNRLRVVERQLEITAETQAHFVRMWLAATAEIPEEQRDAAYRQAQFRYERFIQTLGKRLRAGQSIFVELPKEVVVKSEDFEEKP